MRPSSRFFCGLGIVLAIQHVTLGQDGLPIMPIEQQDINTESDKNAPAPHGFSTGPELGPQPLQPKIPSIDVGPGLPSAADERDEFGRTPEKYDQELFQGYKLTRVEKGDSDELRWQKQRRNAALELLEVFANLESRGHYVDQESRLKAIHNWLIAELSLAKHPRERVAATEVYVKAMRGFENSVRARVSIGSERSDRLHQIEYDRANAELMLLTEKAAAK